MTDPEIVSLYWKRDESAIKHTQSKYNAYLTRISYNILTNLEDCSEAVNDTYLAAWNSMPDNRPEVLSTYLGKITRQLSIDIFRKRKSKNAPARNMPSHLMSLRRSSLHPVSLKRNWIPKC